MEKKCQSAPTSFLHKSSQTMGNHQYSLIQYPTFSSLTKEGFGRAVNFKPESPGLCKSSWYRDMKDLHVRNKSILELPFFKPSCCCEMYNAIIDRRKKKKLQKYGLTRGVRQRNSLELEKIERCIPLEDVDKQIIARFPECYTLFECSSSEEREALDEEDEECSDKENEEESGSRTNLNSEKKCSCDENKPKALEKGTKWKELLHNQERQICKDVLALELKKLRLGINLKNMR